MFMVFFRAVSVYYGFFVVLVGWWVLIKEGFLALLGVVYHIKFSNS